MEIVCAEGNERELEKIITKFTFAAMGAAIVPLPVADIFAITGVQVWMLKEINQMYQRRSLSFDEAIGAAVTAAAGVLTWASLAKLLPGIGTLIGGAAQATIAGAATYGLGMTWIELLERGKPFSIKEMKDSFASWYKRSKQVAGELRNDRAKMLEESRSAVIDEMKKQYGEDISIIEENLKTATLEQTARIIRLLSRHSSEGKIAPMSDILKILGK